MTDPVTLERSSLLDLININRILIDILVERKKVFPLSSFEEERLVFAGKCMDDIIVEFKTNNP